MEPVEEQWPVGLCQIEFTDGTVLERPKEEKVQKNEKRTA